MGSNLDRFNKDIDRLINDGELLDLAMIRDLTKPEEFREMLAKGADKKGLEEFIKTIPNFNTAYESWYSEALAFLRQLLPDRVKDFAGYYEKPKGRKFADFGSYVIQDYLQGLQSSRGGQVLADRSAAVPQFRQQLAILKAAKARFKSSLFEIKQLVQADVLDNEVAVARELLKHKFLRAAGVVAGVVLERHLSQVCLDHALVISKKNPGIGDLNEMLKANSVIDVPQWRHIGLLADIRNICAHNKAKEPAPDQVGDLIDGTVKILKTVT